MRLSANIFTLSNVVIIMILRSCLKHILKTL
nr:MAG TPA: hypothetical protein [Caudoviricetes sp.]